jgi:hypothetical protein
VKLDIRKGSEIGLIIVLALILLWAAQQVRDAQVEERRDEVIRQTYEAEYGPAEFFER